MPKTSSKLPVDARISIYKQYLTKTEVLGFLREKFDLYAPGLRLKGVVICSITGACGRLDLTTFLILVLLFQEL